MNRLQHLPAGQDYIVTLNAPGRSRPRPGHQPDGLRASRLHAGLGRRAAPPARAEHPGHRVRRRLPRLGLPRGRLPVRRPGGPRRSGGPGDGGRRPLAPGAALYECRITHTRLAPLRNVFTYRTYQWLVDLDHLPRLGPGLRLLAGFHARDHLGDPRRPIRANLDHFLMSQGVDTGGGRVMMLAHARVLGYVFNPLTVYWCHRPDGTLACVVAEVHNTYRQRHAYLLHPDDRGRAQVPKRVLRLAVLPGRRRLPDEPARAGPAGRPGASHRPPGAERHAHPPGRALRSWPACTAPAGRPPRGPCSAPPPGTPGPRRPSPPGSGGRGSGCTCAGLPVVPRPPSPTPGGASSEHQHAASPAPPPSTPTRWPDVAARRRLPRRAPPWPGPCSPGRWPASAIRSGSPTAGCSARGPPGRTGHGPAPAPASSSAASAPPA